MIRSIRPFPLLPALGLACVSGLAQLPTPCLAQPFIDRAISAGLSALTSDMGVAWGNSTPLNSWPDLYVTKANGANRLYLNNNNGTFTDISASSGTNLIGQSRGAAWADFNNDGYGDIYLVTANSPNHLYRNNQDQTFTDVGAASGTANVGEGTGAAWADYDNDGYVDLYVTNYGSPNLLYHNNRNGTFTDVGAASGTGYSGNSNGATWGDYDNDRDLDLYVAVDNTIASCKLYRNNGNGTFTNVVASTGLNDNGTNMAAAWGDYDNDSRLDLYVTKYGTANRLYHNNGNGTFTETGGVSGTADVGNGTGVTWADFDLDRDLDLYVVNDGTPNRLYRNNGNGTFSEVAAAMNVADAGNGRGATFVDYDLDGDVDLYVANQSGTSRLFRNESAVPPGNNFVQVILLPTMSNKAALGTRVVCSSNGLNQIRELSGGSGYMSQPHHYANFGVGNALGGWITVYWPSGANSDFPVESQWHAVWEPKGFQEDGGLTHTNDLGGGYVGVAWGDYDNDGDLDLYLPKDNDGPNMLYRNDGNHVFTDVAAASGTNSTGFARATAWADYDNDGDLDLYVSYEGLSRLFKNNGNGTFTDVAGPSGVSNNSIGRGVAWGDYDRDGKLDLYVANHGGPNRLYRNNGNGTFTDMAAASGTADTQNSDNATWGDFDNDGDLDLYVATFGGANRLYRNNGNGTFTDVAIVSGTGDQGNSTGAEWGDMDNDGDLDLYVAKFNEPNRLYRNNGNGTFTDIGPSSSTNNAGFSLGVAWADYDNDGNLDLFVGRGNEPLPHSLLYRNLGDGTFAEVTVDYGMDATYGVSVRGSSWSDYDNDGDLDLYMAVDGLNQLYTNVWAVPLGRHWLQVDLVGTQSNRSGIGARIRCIAAGVTRIRDVSGGAGYLSQPSLTAEFGLGIAPAAVDTLEVRWPSGVVQAMANVALDQRLTVMEPTAASVPQAAVLPSDYALYANIPNPFNPSTVIAFDLPRSGGVELTVFDTAGRPVRKLLAGAERPAGHHQIAWDGRSDQGTVVASGIYFYRIVANDFRATRRMTLLK